MLGQLLSEQEALSLPLLGMGLSLIQPAKEGFGHPLSHSYTP